MIVVVSDKDIESHPTKKFLQILAGISAILAQNFSEVAIRILVCSNLVGLEHR